MTKIEWTEATWNPIVGCSLASPGCTNCYAMKFAGTLLAHVPKYDGLTQETKAGPVWTGKLHFDEKALLEPLRWKKPRLVFVNSMGDLFHEDCPDDWIDRVFAVMALCPQHTFQVLTKRSARMREYCLSRYCSEAGSDNIADAIEDLRPNTSWEWDAPLPNVWLGVSVEDQQRADERIPDLLATPATVRWISAEPLLGPVSIIDAMWARDHIVGLDETIDWVAAGGESGKGSRPMHPDWARSLRDQCATAAVPFFFKQWGEWEVSLDRERDDPDWRADYSNNYVDHGKSRWLNIEGGRGFHGDRFVVMRQVGKKRAGRLLDGALHDAMPDFFAQNANNPEAA
ncbi:phage Gp37/Gp68 family protein [Erythrobacter sp. NFXS35]|uniref:phage Gp37/Gp68 family protein n=1 Tax=Erythrobacter sp. NFXS35 TaxID=2818436 RepID=UPI0032DEB60C